VPSIAAPPVCSFVLVSLSWGDEATLYTIAAS